MTISIGVVVERIEYLFDSFNSKESMKIRSVTGMNEKEVLLLVRLYLFGVLVRMCCLSMKQSYHDKAQIEDVLILRLAASPLSLRFAEKQPIKDAITSNPDYQNEETHGVLR